MVKAAWGATKGSIGILSTPDIGTSHIVRLASSSGQNVEKSLYKKPVYVNASCYPICGVCSTSECIYCTSGTSDCCASECGHRTGGCYVAFMHSNQLIWRYPKTCLIRFVVVDVEFRILVVVASGKHHHRHRSHCDRARPISLVIV